MKCDYSYKCDVTFTNGKLVHLISCCGQSIEFLSYTQIMDSINDEVSKYLVKHGSKQSDIREITIQMKYYTEKEQFFYNLLDKTGETFKTSATRKKYPKENWNFAICDTPIQKGKGLFFGLNWGGDDIDQQSVYPPKEKDRTWEFISNSRPYFRDYFKERIEDLNYSNLCFFRSPNMRHFVSSDWKLAIPLFEEYVNFVEPKWTLMLGKPPSELKQYLTNYKRFDVINESNGRRVFGYTGTLFGKYPFGSVPHTESQISTQARQDIWKKVSNQLK